MTQETQERSTVAACLEWSSLSRWNILTTELSQTVFHVVSVDTSYTVRWTKKCVTTDEYFIL